MGRVKAHIIYTEHYQKVLQYLILFYLNQCGA